MKWTLQYLMVNILWYRLQYCTVWRRCENSYFHMDLDMNNKSWRYDYASCTIHFASQHRLRLSYFINIACIERWPLHNEVMPIRTASWLFVVILFARINPCGLKVIWLHKYCAHLSIANEKKINNRKILASHGRSIKWMDLSFGAHKSDRFI